MKTFDMVTITEDQINIKKICNHLERIRMNIDKIIDTPMSIRKIYRCVFQKG